MTFTPPIIAATTSSFKIWLLTPNLSQTLNAARRIDIDSAALRDPYIVHTLKIDEVPQWIRIDDSLTDGLSWTEENLDPKSSVGLRLFLSSHAFSAFFYPPSYESRHGHDRQEIPWGRETYFESCPHFPCVGDRSDWKGPAEALQKNWLAHFALRFPSLFLVISVSVTQLLWNDTWFDCPQKGSLQHWYTPPDLRVCPGSKAIFLRG